MSRGLPLFDTHPTAFLAAQREGFIRGFCVHVVDGDTYDILIDRGFYDYSVLAIRLLGVDTPEINSGPPEVRARGQAARAFAQLTLLDQPVLIRTYKDRQTFDRYLADVILVPDDTSMARLLREAGHEA